MRDALLWATNVTLYGCLFAGGDLVHQCFSCKERVDWTHTRNMAVVAFGFHGNFSFFWMRFLERRFPSNALRKLLLDQTLAAPLGISAFYTGELSFMEGREEILDWREKFLYTALHDTQFLNLTLVPPLILTAFTGCCGFIWATFLCFSQQSGDGTITAALDRVRGVEHKRQEQISGTDRAEWCSAGKKD
uniref:Uncharacterized protein n=2 Tax=Cyprinus carpio TaxID=7962 RepID=A0A8C1D9H0_CYPCA